MIQEDKVEGWLWILDELMGFWHLIFWCLFHFGRIMVLMFYRGILIGSIFNRFLFIGTDGKDKNRCVSFLLVSCRNQ